MCSTIAPSRPASRASHSQITIMRHPSASSSALRRAFLATFRRALAPSSPACFHRPAPPSIPDVLLSRRLLRFASARAYIAAMDHKFWKKALREAERELDAAPTRTALNAAAKKLMRAKAELKRLEGQVRA